MQAQSVTAGIMPEGIQSYCDQICGGSNCGTGPVCMHGVSATSQLPIYDAFGDSIIAEDGEGTYNAVEIHGVREIDAGTDEACYEVDNDTPELYSVYLHRVEGGICCVGDFGLPAWAVQYAKTLSTKYGYPVYNHLSEHVILEMSESVS